MILLASRSPQRAWLLARAGLAFRVVASLADADEAAITAAEPEDLARLRARAKALAAVLTDEAEADDLADGEHGGELVVLGADTVVALGQQVFGTPRDDAEALATLQALSGTTHRVITAQHLVLWRQGRMVAEAGAAAVVQVTMRVLGAAEIAAYVASGESAGRAGAYAIQEHGDRFVVRLDGAWDTVVGLHVPLVEQLHQRLLGRPAARAGGASGAS